MPTSNTISQNEKRWLLKYIEDNFNLSLENSYGCKELSYILDKQHNIQISYNTLRRMFGIVQSDSLPSHYTLDKLVSVIGFNNYKAFKLHINTFDTDNFNSMLMHYRMNKNYNVDDLLQLVRNSNFDNFEEAYKLQCIIGAILNYEDYDLLLKIINIPFDVKDSKKLELLFLAFQEIHIAVRKNDEKLIKFLNENIQQSIVLQIILLQWYVCEDDLLGEYGKLLEKVTTTQIEDFKLFQFLLLIQKFLALKQPKKAKNYFLKSIAEYKSKTTTPHPILLGRLAAWEFIFEHSNKLCNQFYKSLTTNLERADFLTFYYRLVWTYKDEDYINHQIDLKKVNNFSNIKTLHTQRALYKFFIIKANCLNILNEDKRTIEALIAPIHKDNFLFADGVWFVEKHKELLQIEQKSITTLSSTLKVSSIPITSTRKKRIV